MQQYFFTRLQRRQLKQIQPRRAVHLGQGCGLNQRQTFRHRQGVTGIHHHLLCHATTRQQRAHPVANLPRRTRAHFTDHTGAFQTQYLTGSRRWRIQAGALQQVCPIEPGSCHTNTDLSYITGGAWLFNPLHLTFNALQCFHSASIVSLD